jgi:DNA primase
MKIEGISFPEALRKLAARAGVEIEERPLSDAEKQLKQEREQQRAIMLLTAQHYRDILTRQPEGATARSYLQEREVDPETAAAYGLGFASERRDNLIQLLKAKGFHWSWLNNLVSSARETGAGMTCYTIV